MRIAIEGSIQTRSWDASDGTKRYATEVITDHAEFASDKKNDNEGQSYYPSKPTTPTGDIDGFMPVDLDEDLPF